MLPALKTRPHVPKPSDPVPSREKFLRYEVGFDIVLVWRECSSPRKDEGEIHVMETDSSLLLVEADSDWVHSVGHKS